MDKYLDILKTLQPDELYIEGAYMMKGDLTVGEEVSKVFVKKVIKKDNRDDFARFLKKKYGVDRVNFISAEL